MQGLLDIEELSRTPLKLKSEAPECLVGDKELRDNSEQVAVSATPDSRQSCLGGLAGDQVFQNDFGVHARILLNLKEPPINVNILGPSFLLETDAVGVNPLHLDRNNQGETVSLAAIRS